MAHPLLLANAQSLFGRACSPKGLEKGPLISPSLAPVLPSRATVEDGGGEGEGGKKIGKGRKKGAGLCDDRVRRRPLLPI